MGSEEIIVLMFAVPHPTQRARVQYEVGREGPVGRQVLGRRARDRRARVWVRVRTRVRTRVLQCTRIYIN